MKKFWLLALALFLFLRLPSLFEPYWYGDEGIYLTLGQAINQNQLLYRQIHDNKPPSLYYLAALTQTVFGFRLLLLLWMIPTIYVFYLLSKKLSKFYKLSTFIFLLLTSVPLIEGNIANSEIFMLLPTLICLLLILKAKNPTSYFLPGLFLGLAFTLKFPAIAELAFLFFFITVTALPKFKLIFSRLFHLCLGFIFPIFLWGLYFYFFGTLKEFLFASLLQNFSYLSSWTTGSHSGSATQSGLLGRLFLLLLSYFLSFLLYRRKIFNRQLLFLFALFFSSLFGATLSSRPYPHYLIQILPSFTILLTIFPNSSSKTKTVVLLSLFFLLFTVNKYRFYFYRSIPYYYNFYSYLFHLRSLTDYRSYFGDQVNDAYATADFIKQSTLPEEKIFIWADHPYLYALSQRLPIGRFTVAYHIVDFSGHQETISAIKAKLPRFIIYNFMPDRPFPELDQLLNRYYFLSQKFGSNLIYQLR